MQVVVCNWVGDPFKAWVAGSSPAALTKISKYLADLGRVAFRHPGRPEPSLPNWGSAPGFQFLGEFRRQHHLDDLSMPTMSLSKSKAPKVIPSVPCTPAQKTPVLPTNSFIRGSTVWSLRLRQIHQVNHDLFGLQDELQIVLLRF